MGDVKIKWDGDRFKRDIEQKILHNLERAAITLKNIVKQSIGEPSNHGETPSLPGEYPHKDTGHLRRSVSHEVDTESQSARVGTNLKYGKWLMTGTKRMPPRPFLTKALNENLAKIRNIILGK